MVTENALPTAGITGTATVWVAVRCLLLMVQQEADLFTNYQWNLGGSPIGGANAATYAASAPGSYTVTITNSNTCTFTSAHSGAENALPTASIGGTPAFCTGGNTLLTATATAGSGVIINYQWNLGGSPIGGANATTYSATAAGLYSVTITNSNGCKITSADFAVTQNALPTATATSDAPKCEGSTLTLTATVEILIAGQGLMDLHQLQQFLLSPM